jgi:hypothetical protein
MDHISESLKINFGVKILKSGWKKFGSRIGNTDGDCKAISNPTRSDIPIPKNGVRD